MSCFGEPRCAAPPARYAIASSGGVLCSGADSGRGDSSGAVASFEAACDGEAVHVRGTTGVEVATGIMWFLKYRRDARMLGRRAAGAGGHRPANWLCRSRTYGLSAHLRHIRSIGQQVIAHLVGRWTAAQCGKSGRLHPGQKMVPPSCMINTVCSGTRAVSLCPHSGRAKPAWGGGVWQVQQLGELGVDGGQPAGRGRAVGGGAAGGPGGGAPGRRPPRPLEPLPERGHQQLQARSPPCTAFSIHNGLMNNGLNVNLQIYKQSFPHQLYKYSVIACSIVRDVRLCRRSCNGLHIPWDR